MCIPQNFLIWMHNKWTLNRKYCSIVTGKPLFPLQICDKEWHYYVINVEFPAVTLFVDGVTYEPYLVTDDWPIHTSKIDTQLTVGACWQGQCCVCVCVCAHVCRHPLTGYHQYERKSVPWHLSLSAITHLNTEIHTHTDTACLYWRAQSQTDTSRWTQNCKHTHTYTQAHAMWLNKVQTGCPGCPAAA